MSLSLLGSLLSGASLVCKVLEGSGSGRLEAERPEATRSEAVI